MTTTIKPLSEGAIFKGKIRFHNLRKVEIGALLSSLTFHKNTNASHNLGYAKPFGYGKVKISVKSNSLKQEIDDYIRDFEFTMRKFSISWDIKPLISMAVESQNDNQLIYPELAEFQKYKNDGYFLEPYKNQITVNYLVSQEELQKEIDLEKQRQEEQIRKEKEEQIQKQKELKEKYDAIISHADKLFNEKNWNDALLEYQKALNIFHKEPYPARQRKLCKDYIEGSRLSLSGISSLNDFNNGKKIIEDYFKKATGSTQITNDEQVQILKGFVKRCIEKSSKRWKKEGRQDWVLVKKWIGQDYAKQWFDEFMKK